MWICWRYHYNVADARLAQHVEKGMADGLLISCVASCTGLWAIIMDAGTRFTSQVYELSPSFLRKEWIMDQWEKNYYISSITGSTCGSSLVVMFKATLSLLSGDGFYVTSMATAGSWCGVVVSRNAGFSDKGIHRCWDSGYRITSTAATSDQAALILSIPKPLGDSKAVVTNEDENKKTKSPHSVGRIPEGFNMQVNPRSETGGGPKKGMVLPFQALSLASIWKYAGGP
ncbi:hypothetical protein COLO4_09927 [Corchorus olitorius]|uniref:DUF7477 domain-containing protein n=1 Tax=Corchorus olitorius TaxID=93759 RepID=A0A1R3KAM9_9ROSI|nr:hypothetical protein COLO4_09927 [Corchorus olitorius]